jgi:predicted dinucleotide-binding enzyme
MRIAVLGMGEVGTTLGRQWRNAGHDITFGVRDPAAKRAGAEEMDAEVMAVPAAAASAGVVLLAVPWTAAPGVLEAAGVLSGKTLLDCTNPVTPNSTT